MILMENGRTGIKTCPSGILSSTYPTWTNLGSNPCLRGKRPANNSLSHGTDFKDETYPGFECYLKIQLGPRSKDSPCRYKNTALSL